LIERDREITHSVRLDKERDGQTHRKNERERDKQRERERDTHTLRDTKIKREKDT